MIEHQWEPRGLVRRHFGAVSWREIAQSDASIQADPRFGEVTYVIEDFRRCASLNGIDEQAAKGLGSVSSACTGLPRLFRHAVVLTVPLFHKTLDLLNGLGYQHLEAFQFMADARDWAIPG